MTSIIHSTSPVPMPHSVSPIYSQRLPSITPTPSYMHNITPTKQTDMIHYPSEHSHPLLISFLQYIGVVGILLLCIMIFFSIRFELSKKKKKVKQDEGFYYHSDYSQQINHTAYNKLNIIRRASSNSLNTSPV